ncbi:hypothetical protein MK851_15200 [Tenacibaculum sp. 1B UA]|uniref:hypothetical protein n=1 Tax=Tenacibaculum sp. 1B UA TaxID=2922252 RepID=UPI002A23A3C6|nr:hypothetical protein [Tenacibaculum sp. 1B UA]MDX8554961.1 hypothetical protein [Tenacibaculum sp. 1B UA]
MLENILNLEGLTVLEKKQQESVNGGGTCASIMRKYEADGTYVEIVERNLTRDEAFNSATYAGENWAGGSWCCSSCGSASWL